MVLISRKESLVYGHDDQRAEYNVVLRRRRSMGATEYGLSRDTLGDMHSYTVGSPIEPDQ
ncbi:hypothetical protein NEUTE1DRAFT_116331 [Neurospora tetrasperma FGSC 2508]|uniref:Uncharacterized protein n=1 Tax=Neurospora tetrasperma (strain FGSC 2508 / ATCC MYA-4615 / P0657) TaxID=510951 RepID=F8MIG0_NEUT8|nr:uncharacterized protein NEUTE1DRAFT_116331 [Neurospora tetrasperma FGSC 2508]EGO58964.1 hypothetical protein NEUTE1DRAFT_116331 [Neurospora tetrasperma FGSC 2508]EGZ73064.1 hypothetical protein NEUTE2DRAFT_107171 [Neurospora tetrasperma FGSC 2509]